MSREPRTFEAVDFEELDDHINGVQLSVNSTLIAAGVALQTASAAFGERRVDPTDRASLIASSEQLSQASRSLHEAARLLDGHAHLLLAGGLIAYHRAPLPKQAGASRRRR